MREFEKEPIEWQRLTGLALAAAKLGHAERARAGLATALGRLGEAAAYQYAEINAQLGDRDEAFRWLGVAQRIKDPGLSIVVVRSTDGPVARRSAIQEADARARVRCARPRWLIGFTRRAWRGGGHMTLNLGGVLTAAALLIVAAVALASPEDDRASVAALDTQYQAAVKRNDAETMGRILADDFVLVLGNGKTYTREDLLESARAGKIVYERQDEDEGTQIVRVWGDTAVVTARLWLKGVNEGVAFERRLWFSDTYVRTPTGWRYAFGQAFAALACDRASRRNETRRLAHSEVAPSCIDRSRRIAGTARVRRSSCSRCIAFAASVAHAEKALDDLDGDDLTPIGAERAGNADDTIPAWEGGLMRRRRAGPSTGLHRSVSGRQTALYDQRWQRRAIPVEADRRPGCAAAQVSAELQHERLPDAAHGSAAEGRDRSRCGPGRQGFAAGFWPQGRERLDDAFPDSAERPRSNLEPSRAISWWRHCARRPFFPVRSNGDFYKIGFKSQRIYAQNVENPEPNRLFYALGYFTEPATLRGTIFLVHEPLDQVAEQRSAWIYNSGARRVRRAPDLAYDGVNDGSEGMLVTDQVDGYNGAPDRYEWKLLDKREVYVPYNTYRLSDKTLKYKEIIRPHSINPEYVRYELHRVWVVEGTLKPGSVMSTASARSISTKTPGACSPRMPMTIAASSGAHRCTAAAGLRRPGADVPLRHLPRPEQRQLPGRRSRQRDQGPDPVQNAKAKVGDFPAGCAAPPGHELTNRMSLRRRCCREQALADSRACRV